MAFKPNRNILKLRNEDYAIQRQSEPAVDAINDLTQNPLVNSREVSATFVVPIPAVPGDPSESPVVRVRHRLNHVYSGWTVVCIFDGMANIVEVANNPNKSTDLLLKAVYPIGPTSEVTFTVKILVY